MLLWYFWQCSILGNGKDRHMQCTWTCSLESHVKRDRWLFRTKDNDGPQVVSLPHTFRTQEYREPFVTISGSKTKTGKNGRLFLYCLKKKKSWLHPGKRQILACFHKRRPEAGFQRWQHVWHCVLRWWEGWPRLWLRSWEGLFPSWWGQYNPWQERGSGSSSGMEFSLTYTRMHERMNSWDSRHFLSLVG